MENLDPLFEIAGIIAKEKTTGLNEKEALILKNWLDQSENNRNIYAGMNKTGTVVNAINETGAFHSGKAWKKIKSHLDRKSETRRFYLPALYKYAASIIILIASAYFIFFYSHSNLFNRNTSALIEPGTQKAVLITPDKRRIELGKTTQKRVYKEKTATLIDTSSTLLYQNNDNDTPELQEENIAGYNELITPTGGEYNLILPDGSKVKLNSQSNLKFPAAFGKDKREVELDGEAYFEVAKSPDVPFIVKTNSMRTVVYGTSFNISAYADDNYIQTTLITGSVGIELHQGQEVREFKLVPGQQASLDKTLNSITTKEVNTDIYTAWTKGLFVFENEPLEQILQKLSRWYDFEVEFENDSLKKEPFTGDLKRYESMNKILEMIAVASDIGFKTEGKKLMVFTEK